MPAILPDITATEALVIAYTNQARQREKLGVVHQDKALAIAARTFAQYLAKTETFSHTADGRQPAMRASAAGYKYCRIGCEPKMLAFLSAGSVAISGQYAAENGKVYMVSQKAGAVTIEAKVGEKEE